MHHTTSAKIALIAFATLSLLSACSQLEQLKTDVQKSTENAAKEVQSVRQNLQNAKESLDRKVDKVNKFVDAANDLKKEFSTNTP